MAGLKDAPKLYRFLHRVLPPIVNPWFPVNIEGLDNIPAQRPAIVAANHLSFIDSIFMPVNIPRPVYFLAKAEYFDSWRTRWFFAGAGCVPTRRDNPDAAMAALLTGVDILNSGELLGIYPEGTRSPDGRLYRGKTGPLRMALTAEVPIIPVGIIGTDKVMPTGSRFPKRVPVTVRYGEPLEFAQYRGHAEDRAALRAGTDELMYEIMQLSGQEYVDEYARKPGRPAARAPADSPPGEQAPSSDGDPTATDVRRAG
ncbi:MAG: lysophospholipid acyltransferase family protein [Nitriliruptorales bacterium]|nr:lysophospholipid acyltransferase family protein [Nitriliruptorales bacterium]